MKVKLDPAVHALGNERRENTAQSDEQKRGKLDARGNEISGAGIDRGKKNGRRPGQELRINSRAANWARSEANRGRAAGRRRDDPRGPGERAREAWAAARAGQTRDRERDDKENLVSRGPTRPIATNNVAATDGRNGARAQGRPGDGGHFYKKNRGLQKEWERRDNHHAKSALEGEMERLLDLLNATEVGTVSSSSAQLPMELSDGEGGAIATVEEQNLASAVCKMMERWTYHKNWSADEARLAGQILLRMEKEEVFGGGDKVAKDVYVSVINAYSKVTEEDETASVRADNLLDHMENRSSERPDLKPDRFMINTALGAQAKHALGGSSSTGNISAAERMLSLLEREYASGDSTMQPTARTYSKIIDLYAKHGRPEDAEGILLRMEAQYCGGNKAALPRTYHYTNVIDAFAKKAAVAGRAAVSGRAAETAENVLRSMLDLYDRGHKHLAPDAVVFNATIDAYSKSKRPDAAERSLDILGLMDGYCKPDMFTYNIVLNTLSNDPRFHSKCKEMLGFIEQNPDLSADSFTYNSVIKGCPPEESEELIKHWEMQYKLGRTSARPDSFTYSSLIRSLIMTNTIGYEEKCVEILLWMEENDIVGMNRIVYNEVMRAISRSSRDDAGLLAERVYNKLLARYEQSRDKEFRPDEVSLVVLMNAHCRSCKSHSCAIKAHEILLEMMDSGYLPNSKHCNTVISAWSRSGSIDAVAHAEAVYDRMKSLGIEVDGVVFNSLINVYAKTGGANRSVDAMNVLGRMREQNVLPTSVTYTFLLEACLGNEESLLHAFESCTRDGMLDEKLRGNFLMHGPACIREQLTGKIPYVWSQHSNRGPRGPSRRQIKASMKKGSVGADVKQFGWAG